MKYPRVWLEIETGDLWEVNEFVKGLSYWICQDGPFETLITKTDDFIDLGPL